MPKKTVKKSAKKATKPQPKKPVKKVPETTEKKRIAKKPNNVGRPQRQFSEKEWQQFENLCRIFSTQREIIIVMDVHRDTLERLCIEKYGMGFRKFLRKGNELGKSSLRVAMMKKALGGDVKMQIHMAKQYLGHADRTKATIKQTVTTKHEGDPMDMVLAQLTPEVRKEVLNAYEALKKGADS